MTAKQTDSDWNNSSDEDIDLALIVSFEELRIKNVEHNTNNALIIDSNHYFVEYPSLILKIYDIFKHCRINNKNECDIREFQSTNNFCKKPHRIHCKILIKNRKEMRSSYFDKIRVKYLNRNNDNDNNVIYINESVSDRANQMIQHLPEWVEGCKSDDRSIQFECTQQIRKLLSIEQNPPIRDVIDSDIVPKLISFMKKEYRECERLQFEAAWTITNIASGAAENTQYVIKHGAVPIFINLLKSPSIEIQEQAAWGLGNIAGDSVECRDIVLNHNILKHLIPIFDIFDTNPLPLRRTITWTLSNIARGKPVLKMVYTKQVIEIFNKLILNKNEDSEILQDIAWGYKYLFAGYNVVVGNGYKLKTELLIYGYLREIKEKELNSMVIPQDITTMLILFAPIADIYIPCHILQRFIELLSNDNTAHVRHPSLRAINEILMSKTENDNTKQLCLEYGLLQRLIYILKNDKITIKREACSLINNLIIHAKYKVIKKIIDEGIMDIMIKILKEEINESLINEALYSITNIIRNGNDEQIKIMVNNKGVIETVGAMKKPVIEIMHCMQSIINSNDKYIEKIRNCKHFMKILKTYDNGANDLRNKLIAKIGGFVVTF